MKKKRKNKSLTFQSRIELEASALLKNVALRSGNVANYTIGSAKPQQKVAFNA